VGSLARQHNTEQMVVNGRAAAPRWDSVCLTAFLVQARRRATPDGARNGPRPVGTAARGAEKDFRNRRDDGTEVAQKGGGFAVMLIAAGLLIALCANGLQADDSFVAIRPEQTSRYRIDFAKHFYPTRAEEKASRASLLATVGQLEALKGQIASSPSSLVRALALSEEVDVAVARHDADLTLRAAIDARDRASIEERDALVAQVDSRRAFLWQEILGLSENTIADFSEREPALARYRFALEVVRRNRPHALPVDQEEILSTTEPSMTGWQSALYHEIEAHIRFAPVDTPMGPRDPVKNRAELANSWDPKVREAAFRARYAGWASQRDLVAFALIELARARNQIARLRHFEDAGSEAYFRSFWSKGQVAGFLERIAARADLYKRYQRLRAAAARHATRLPDANLWDLPARPVGFTAPRFRIDEATQILSGAVAVLGPDYRRQLSALLDPNNGRMDIVPGEHRRRSNFSKGFIGTDSVFFSSGFTGTYNDVRVLMHESTHAIQRQLMTENRVLPSYAEGPHWVFEGIAIVNELLLPDFLATREADSMRKTYFLEQFLDGKGTAMFSVAPEAVLEQEIYDGVAAGRIQGPNDVDALTRQVFTRFSIWPDRVDLLRGDWMTIPLMYDDPFYDLNYVMGSYFALAVYDRLRRDPEQFAPRFVAMMKNGFDAQPRDLLRRFLDIDLDDPRTEDGVFRIIEGKVRELEESYRTAGIPIPGAETK
jgi:oligoendopeptidase F